MHIANNLAELIGNTPLVRLSGYSRKHALVAELVAKPEYFNPLGSVKDRVALSMLEEGVRSGQILPTTTIIEPTSGNTGIGLAYLCAIRGLALVLTMPANMSEERKMLLTALGARLVLTEPALGMAGAIQEAHRLQASLPDSFVPMQFENPANPAAHTQTAAEILRDTDDNLDVFLCCIGTGGTITGIGRALKAVLPQVQVIGVEPSNSPMISKGTSGSHKIQGIGAGFIPSILDLSVVDSVLTVTDEDAFAAAREVALSDGMLVGISSGAALFAAASLAKLPAYSGKSIVILLPDSGERYLSTPLFQLPPDGYHSPK